MHLRSIRYLISDSKQVATLLLWKIRGNIPCREYILYIYNDDAVRLFYRSLSRKEINELRKAKIIECEKWIIRAIIRPVNVHVLYTNEELKKVIGENHPDA